MVKIDLKDKRILAELDMNARIPIAQLAKKVGLSRQVTEYRIKRMQKDKIIFNSIAIFDSAVAGFNWYRVVIRFSNISRVQKEEFIKYLKENQYTLWIGEVGGNWDMAINFVCRNNFEFNHVFEEMIAKYGVFIKDYEVLIYIDVYDLQRKYILEKRGNRNYIYHEMKYNPKVSLDNLDKKIINSLKDDALKTNFDLATSLGVAPNTIKNRISAMQKAGLLLGFRTLINPSVFGYKSHMLFLEITRLNLNREEELYDYLRSISNVTFLVKHIGKWRIGMEIETKDDEEFHNLSLEIKGRFSDIITDSESFPLFRDHKIDYFPEANLN